jgi:hypothetical protein
MQSDQTTQPLQWIRERKQRNAQQRRHDLIVDALALPAAGLIVVLLYLIALR